jgi:hypothetical protein
VVILTRPPVTATVRVLDDIDADCHRFAGLVNSAAETLMIRSVAADEAYPSCEAGTGPISPGRPIGRRRRPWPYRSRPAGQARGLEGSARIALT